MASPKKTLFLVLTAIAIATTTPLGNPFSLITDSASSLFSAASRFGAPDPTFRSTMDPHLRSLVDQIRRGPSPYYFDMMDHTSEPFIYDLALPRLFEAGGTRYFTYGPQSAPIPDERGGRLYQRWARMAFAALCWFGAGWWIFPGSLALALLCGMLVTGWTLEAICLATGLPSAAIYDFWSPLALISAVIGLLSQLKRARTAPVPFRAGTIVALGLLLAWPMLAPYLTQPLQAWDGRVMWGYHFKFQFFEGFRADRILAYMHPVAERDYPWFLGGAVGLASWRDGTHFSGWHENAVYGALLVPVAALFSLAWSRFGRNAGLIFITFTAVPFAALLSNGYMEALWIPAFALAYVGALHHEGLSPLGRGFTLPGPPPFTGKEIFMLACLAASTKNEGLACLGAAMLWRALRYDLPEWAKGRAPKLRPYAATFAALLPALLHKAYVSTHGLTDQYRLGERLLTYPPYDALKRFESLHRYLVKDLFLAKPAYWAPAALFALSLFLFKKSPRGLGRNLAAATYAFLAPALLVYVYTPHDQQWQLETSAPRVFLVLPILFALLAGTQVKHPAK